MTTDACNLVIAVCCIATLLLLFACGMKTQSGLRCDEFRDCNKPHNNKPKK